MDELTTRGGRGEIARGGDTAKQIRLCRHRRDGAAAAVLLVRAIRGEQPDRTGAAHPVVVEVAVQPPHIRARPARLQVLTDRQRPCTRSVSSLLTHHCG